MPVVRPTQIFPGYTSDGTNITIPIASLPKLTAAAANATTGDGADVLWAIVDQAYEANQALAPEAKSSVFAVTKGNQTAVQGAPDARNQPYTATFKLQPTGLETMAEA